jgi:uncharacterized nucleotidyltransferase DUF6036
MRRPELEHVIRAAATASGDDELVIVGSQAILGQFPEAPASMLVSREADIYPRNHPERGDEIEGSLGDGSYFDSTFGYYAHAVGPETAKAPDGWEQRLVPIRNENTGGATGWCLEVHDLLLSKCAAGRERDWEFVEQALRHRLADASELQRRSADLPLDRAQIEVVQRMVGGIAARVGPAEGGG